MTNNNHDINFNDMLNDLSKNLRGDIYTRVIRENYDELYNYYVDNLLRILYQVKKYDKLNKEHNKIKIMKTLNELNKEHNKNNMKIFNQIKTTKNYKQSKNVVS